jgi:hypothetical protein
VMAIQRWNPSISSTDRGCFAVMRANPHGEYVSCADHLAEVRERERCAWMNHGEWLYQTLATTGRLPSRDEAEAEAARRYPKEEKA